MPSRKSEATWQGDLKNGKGTMKVGAGHYEGPFTYASRFESGPGTNPEELIGAAHAGCFSMAFSNTMAKEGFIPTSVHTVATVHLNAGKIDKIDLATEAVVPGITNDKFQQLAEQAKATCPVSVALAAVDQITLNAKLMNS